MIVAVCFIAVFAQGFAYGDDSLVLHYTFDKGVGQTVSDLSGNGNDGKIVKAQPMDELNGRQGVLRFDGETAHISFAATESLRFGGDITLEMWVRGNNPDHKGGVLVSWGRSLDFYGLEEPLVQYRSGSDVMRTALKGGGRLLTGQWKHVALTVEYPRVRLYVNGELRHDAYMPFAAIAPDKATRHIASKCPVDLDEIRVYRRALTAREVAAHAQGKEIPRDTEAELAVETHWYEKTISLRLSCKGERFRGRTAMVTLKRGDYTDVASGERLTLAESFKGSGRYVATAVVPLSGFENQTIDATARMLNADGQVVETVYRHACLKKPDWVHTREGYTDKVLAPWTPMETDARPDGTVEVAVWGRAHVFGPALFPMRIQTKDAEILAAPIALVGRADGKDIAWTGGRVVVNDASDTAVSLAQACESGNAAIRMSTRMEYDGYMIFDCEVKALRDTTLESLVLDIPLQTRYATLCFGANVYPEQKTPRKPVSVFHMGAVKGDLAFRFSPNIWLGDEERGLTWQAESNEDWRYADAQKAIEILPRGDITRFRANWVNVPTKLAEGQSLHYKFALQATPVKPLLRDAWDLRILRSDPYVGSFAGNPDLNLPDRWIKTDHARVDRIYSEFVEELNLMEDGPDRTPALDFYANSGARHLWINATDNWPWPMPTDPVYARNLHRLIDAAHAHGLKIYSYLIHERMPTNVPEYDIHGLHMTNLPFKPYDSKTLFCAKSQALQDAIVYNLAQRMDEFGDDGVYLDGTGVHMKSCQNPAHGCGYRPKPGATSVHGTVVFDQTDRGSTGEDGPVYPTYPVFADREFLKRMYTVIKQRRPDGVLDVHSWYYNSGGLAYADMLWTGEQWWHLRGKGVKYVSEELPLDVFRTMFMGTQIGVAAEVLPYRLIGSSQKNRQIAAISLLHDIPVRIRTQDTEYYDLMSKLWKVRAAFGVKAATKRFYWNNQEYVSASPEKSYVTLMQHPENGVLAFMSNLNRDARKVTAAFNLAKLGLQGKKLRVFNPLTGQAVEMSPDGKVTLPLESEDWAYIWLRPVAAN